MFATLVDALRAQVRPTQTHVMALRTDIRTRVHYFTLDRTSQGQSALEQDFAQVLTAWGIEDTASLPSLIHELRLRIVLLALPCLLCLMVAMATQSLVIWLAALFVSPPCLLGILTTCWRIAILKNRRFQSFTHWLCSLVSLAKKGA